MASLRTTVGAVTLGVVLAATAPAGAKPPAPKKHHAAHGKSKHWAHRNDGLRAATAGPTHGAINEDVTLTPFPSQALATRRALAQNRRDRLTDAETAARAAAVEGDRWETVLFHLRDLDSRSDPEGCFWRLVAYYRLGQVERARQVRQTCDLPSRDLAILEAEDAEAASIQTPLALAERDHVPPPVANPAAYAGAPPTRQER
ncbi:MAG TPA: hypothetical protein VHM31_04725 [Polyangia bacterium]|nr:hypothetical protein [Polyangia bacterium]